MCCYRCRRSGHYSSNRCSWIRPGSNNYSPDISDSKSNNNSNQRNNWYPNNARISWWNSCKHWHWCNSCSNNCKRTSALGILGACLGLPPPPPPPNHHVYVVWEEEVTPDNDEIFFTASYDNGRHLVYQ